MGGEFTCDCNADRFTLNVTGTVVEGHGVNFNFLKIVNVQVQGP